MNAEQLDQIQAPAPVAFHRLNRAQLLTLAIALQDQRDNALALVRSQQVRLDEFEAKYGEHTTENQGRGCPACAAAIRVKDRERAALTAAEGAA